MGCSGSPLQVKSNPIPPPNSWTVEETDIEIATYSMADETGGSIGGMTLSKNDGTDTRITLLYLYAHDIHVSEVWLIANLETAKFDNSFNGYWLNDLTISKWPQTD